MDKPTKQKEIKKELSPQELLAQYRLTLKVLQMKNKMGQLVKTHQIKQIKRRDCSLTYQK